MNQDMISLPVLKRMAVLYLIFVVMYFPLLTLIPLTIDAETMAWISDFTGWISQGRWGAYLIAQYIVPESVAPYFVFMLLGLAFSAGYSLIIAASGRRAEAADYAAFPLFCAFPTWLYLADFASNMASVGGAILTCCMGVWLISGQNTRIWRGVAAAMLLSFAIACYQAFVFVFFALSVSVILLRLQAGEPTVDAIRRGVRLIVVSAIGLVLYWIILRLFEYAYGMTQDYVEQFLNLDMLWSEPAAVFAAAVATAARVIGGETWAVFVLLPLGAVALFAGSQRRPRVLVVAGLAFAALLISPFLLLPLTGGTLPERALLGASVPVWAAAILGLRSRTRTLAYASLAAVVLTSMQVIGFSSRVEANKQLTSRHDMLLAGAIYERAAQVSPLTDGVVKLDFFGAVPFQQKYRYTTAAASFFEWDGGNPGRILNYMRLIGFGNAVGLSQQERLNLIPEYSAMPSWPSVGAVKLVGDTVLVKLGPSPGFY